MNRRMFLAGVSLAASLVFAAQVAAAADHLPVYVYTGCHATVVIDLNNASGAALYAYPRFDAAYNTTLTRQRRDHCYYYFGEDEYPRWSWKLAKCPTYCYYGRRRCRTCCCLGYKVQLLERVGEKERVELSFYATRKKVGAFFPIPKEGARGDSRRQ
jgi:hypothetical protein